MLKHLSRPPASLGCTGKCLIVFTCIIERFIGRRDKCVLPVCTCTKRLKETFIQSALNTLVTVGNSRSPTWCLLNKFGKLGQILAGLDKVKQCSFSRLGGRLVDFLWDRSV